jgi:tRNA G18 (ribose-2'-O)-methylase SpoU
MIQKKSTEQLIRERPSSEELRALPRTPISVVVDNVRSLDNVGLLFRLCELARVEHLYVTGYTGHPRVPDDPRPEEIIARHERRIKKTAVYAVPHQPWSYVQDPVPLVRELEEKGSRIIALEQTDQSIPYHKVPPADYQIPITLILGHEREGVRSEMLEAADVIIDIPILGIGNSHNVAIAAGIVLYHVLNQTGQTDKKTENSKGTAR